MNDVRRREGAAGLGLRSTKRPSGNERDDYELQSDQGPRGRADDYVEVLPSVESGHEGPTSLAPRTRRYCSSLTFSIELTTLPSSGSTLAMSLIARASATPCLCFT